MASTLLTICILIVCLVAVLANPGIGFFMLLIGALAAWSAMRGAWGRAQRRKARAKRGQSHTK